MDCRAIPSVGVVAGRRPGRGLLAIAGMAAASYLVCSTSKQGLDFLAGSTGAAPHALRRQLQNGRQPAVLSAAFGSDDADERNLAKANLLDFLDDEGLAQEVQRPEGKPTRGRLDEAILRLEGMSPTEDPVYSELIDGEWMVRYSGSYAPGLLSSPTRELALFLYGGGYSLGSALSSFASGFWGQSFGFKEPKKTVTIDGGRDVKATADLEINGKKSTLKYTAELLPLSGSRMSEEIIDVDFGAPLGKQSAPFELRRSILVTYLDEDTMIVRDESGVPEVLIRTIAPVQPEAPVVKEEATIKTSDPVEAVAANTSAASNVTNA